MTRRKCGRFTWSDVPLGVCPPPPFRALAQQRRLPPESKDQQKPQQDDEPGSAPPNGKLHLSLSLYWAVMALVVLCLMVHQRRSEGLILRRVKTFCLAGTAIFALKMTKTLTQVRLDSARQAHAP